VSSAYTGVVRARYEGDLGFRVGGKITERLVDAGQTVRRGQVIARLDASDLRLGATAALADVAAAERSAAAARAEAVRLRADEARFAALQKRGFASGQRYEQARAGADAASANLAAAEAQVRAARAGAGQAGNQAAYAVLTADADGVVMDVLAEPGQVVGAGQPVVRLARNGAREAVVNTPETGARGLPRTGEAVLYGQEGRPVPAVLRELSAAADPVTRTFEARYTLGGAGAAAPLGSTVTIRTQNAGPSGEIAVPISALHDPGSGPGVWVLDPRKSSVSFRPVKVAALGEETARCPRASAPASAWSPSARTCSRPARRSGRRQCRRRHADGRDQPVCVRRPGAGGDVVPDHRDRGCGTGRLQPSRPRRGSGLHSEGDDGGRGLARSHRPRRCRTRSRTGWRSGSGADLLRPGGDAVTAGQIAMTVLLRDTIPPALVPEQFYQVRKKLSDEAANLPRGVIGPFFNDEYGDVYFALYALNARGLPHRELVREAETLRQRLLRTPGVQKVRILGEQPSRIFVEFSYQRLATLGVTAPQIFEALQRQNTVVGAGSVETAGPRVQLRLDGSLRQSRGHPQRAHRAPGGRTLTLGDVAQFGAVRGPAGVPDPQRGRALAAAWRRHAAAAQRPGARRGARRGGGGHQRGPAARPRTHKISDQAANIEHSYGEFMLKFAVALGVVMLISFLALGFRVGLVVAAAVPLTLAIVFVVMLATGRDFDRITLGALILSLGLLVDDAIIAIEMMVVKMEEGLDRVAAATYAWTSTAAPMLSGRW
jgi:RND family efflux transporter MFP subunit